VFLLMTHADYQAPDFEKGDRETIEGVEVLRTANANQHLEAMVANSRDADFIVRATAGTPFINHTTVFDLINGASEYKADRTSYSNIQVTTGLECVKASSLQRLLGLITAAEFVGQNCEHLRAHGGFPGFYLTKDQARPDGKIRGGFQDVGAFTNTQVKAPLSSPIPTGVNLHISGIVPGAMEEDMLRVALVAKHLGEEGLKKASPGVLAQAYAELNLPLITDGNNPRRFGGPQTSWSELSAS